MQTTLPLMAQAPNPLKAYTEGVSAADAMNEMRRKQDMQSTLMQHGAGMLRGEQSALEAYAKYDPAASFGLQSGIAGEARAERADQRASAAAGRAAEAHKFNMDRARIEQEREDNRRSMTMMIGADTPEKWDELAAQHQPELAGRFGDKDTLIMGLMDFDEALSHSEGMQADALASEFLSAGGQYEGNIGEILQNPNIDPTIKQYAISTIAPTKGFRPATAEEAKSYGAAAGQFGPNGRFYPIDPPEGMSVKVGEDGSVEFVQGAGVGQAAVEADDPRKDYARTWNEETQEYEETIIKGSQEYREMQASARKAETALDSFEESNGLVVEDIDRAIELIESGGIPATGAIGWLTSGVPGSKAYRLNSLLTTVKGNVGFDKLQDMRANSPTGGALGSVSEQENTTLQSTSGSLENANTKEDLLFNLKRLKEMRISSVGRMRDAYEKDFVDFVTPTLNAQNISTMSDADFNNLTADDIRSMDYATREEFIARGEKMLAEGRY